jgi:hypothetical protein
VAITGTLTTENLGIERLVRNTITNPRLRFVIVCGPEVEQRIGHHPGGSLLALATNGTDNTGADRGRAGPPAPAAQPHPRRDRPLPHPRRGRRPHRHRGTRGNPGRRRAVRRLRPWPRA